MQNYLTEMFILFLILILFACVFFVISRCMEDFDKIVQQNNARYFHTIVKLPVLPDKGTDTLEKRGEVKADDKTSPQADNTTTDSGKITADWLGLKKEGQKAVGMY